MAALRVASPPHLEGGGGEEPRLAAHRRPPALSSLKGYFKKGNPRLGVEVTPWTFPRLTSGQRGLYRPTLWGHLVQPPKRRLPWPLTCTTASVPESPLDIRPGIIQLSPWPGQRGCPVWGRADGPQELRTHL